MRARLGAPKAITAVAHKLARILYRMLVSGASYQDLDEGYYEEQYQERVLANLKRRAREIGYILISLEG